MSAILCGNPYTFRHTGSTRLEGQYVRTRTRPNGSFSSSGSVVALTGARYSRSWRATSRTKTVAPPKVTSTG